MNKQPQRDARFVQLAMEEAKKSSVCMQHGCIAVMHGKIIARSFNTTCRVSPTIWWSCHAEMAAIKKINEPAQCRHARKGDMRPPSNPLSGAKPSIASLLFRDAFDM